MIVVIASIDMAMDVSRASRMAADPNASATVAPLGAATSLLQVGIPLLATGGDEGLQ
jgi:hypothetical protein